MPMLKLQAKFTGISVLGRIHWTSGRVSRPHAICTKHVVYVFTNFHVFMVLFDCVFSFALYVLQEMSPAFSHWTTTTSILVLWP